MHRSRGHMAHRQQTELHFIEGQLGQKHSHGGLSRGALTRSCVSLSEIISCRKCWLELEDDHQLLLVRDEFLRVEAVITPVHQVIHEGRLQLLQLGSNKQAAAPEQLELSPLHSDSGERLVNQVDRQRVCARAQSDLFRQFHEPVQQSHTHVSIDVRLHARRAKKRAANNIFLLQNSLVRVD